MEPRLALALFIAPALVDAAYDLPPRELRRDWLPLTWLALIAVVLTTAAVAWVGWALAGMPLAAAIALGAIVAPPDAAAAAAVLTKFPLPRRTMALLRGESLLNDAGALLIFTAAVALATRQETSVVDMIPSLLIAAPGGVVLGLVFARVYLLLKRWLGPTLTARVVAEHLHVSAILAVVTFAITAAHYGSEKQTARDRVHSYAIWQIVVFVINRLNLEGAGGHGRCSAGQFEDRTNNADAVRAEYEAMRAIAQDRIIPMPTPNTTGCASGAVAAQRELLAGPRRKGKISGDAFQRLEEELDWAELHASPREKLEVLDA